MVFGVKTLVKFCSNHTSPYKTLRSTIWVIHGSCHSLTQIPNSEVDDLKGFNHGSENPKTGNWEALTEKPGPINQPTFCYISNTNSSHSRGSGTKPSLKLWVYPWKWMLQKHDPFLFKWPIFRGKLAGCFREGIHFFKGNKKNPQQSPPFHPNLHIHSFFRHGGSTRFNKSLKELGSFGGAMTETTPSKGWRWRVPRVRQRKPTLNSCCLTMFF